MLFALLYLIPKVTAGGFICYQETANVSTSCGGLNTGTYSVAGAWTNANLVYDGSWSTYGVSAGGATQIYVNYTRPVLFLNASWQAKTGERPVTNYTLDPVCLNSTNGLVMLRLWSDVDARTMAAYCYKDFGVTGWQGIFSYYTGAVSNSWFYEESMFWNTSAGNFNIYLDSANYSENDNANVTAVFTDVAAGSVLSVNFTMLMQNGTSIKQTKTATTGGNLSNLSISSLFNVGAASISAVEWRNFSSVAVINETLSNATNVSVSVYRFILTNCSASSASQTRTINFSFIDEQGNQPLKNVTMEIVGNVTGRANSSFSFTLNFTDIASGGLCLYPTTTNYSMTFDAIYHTAGYTSRNYRAFGYFDNVSKQYLLYLLATSVSSEVDFTLKDPIGNKQPGYILDVQRYFYASNSYETVAQAKTDYNGRAFTYLYQPANSFRVVVRNSNGVPVQTFTPVVIDSSVQTGSITGGGGIYAISLTLGQGTQPIYDQFGNIYAACAFSNSTGVLSCTVIDSTLQATSAVLTVDNMTMDGWVNVCTATGVGSSSTPSCAISDWTKSVFRYKLDIYNPDGTFFTAYSGSIDYRSLVLDWGTYGFLLTWLAVITMGAVGIWNPIASLALGGGALVISWMLGIFNVGFATVISFMVLIMLIVWRSRA